MVTFSILLGFYDPLTTLPALFTLSVKISALLVVVFAQYDVLGGGRMRKFKIPDEVLALRSNMEDEILKKGRQRGGGWLPSLSGSGPTVYCAVKSFIFSYNLFNSTGFRPIRSFRRRKK